ncbi:MULTISPECIES: hypothetical protein [unclassified Pseudomonas]|uniref:hypothetical protein n=1 Tax=unclassified Pseudomonas TaxID=196821 RepID=UPI000876A00A|nr:MULTISPECIES: hypothetical protein [unclassified Pseudomonas]SCZ46109.1 hypothetical protein SAMN03159405_05585 [Pseudomonas sp. NFACC44-2]SDA91418.1 hypothetical protein SAMN03159429_06046 [Pseudomonas sp. NFACC51]SEK02293.1 hypothetical protein SAMN03159298_05846 [Pseudomonas sp. NFACC07-1]SFJ10107.1 hypothetical protein SAMN03159302_05315 [Pseudomonas sp. NFACC54]SFT30441.1 hypothetical protein SAMN03159306_05967 [Pseudomonas sp. NFACC48-1]
MIDSKHTPDPNDEVLIEHFRQHTSGEPPASLDAFILATAHREAPTPAPSLWQRWLQACQRPRWQMAFATIAGVALMIGLVLRSPVPHDELSSPASMEFSADRQAPAVAAAPPPAMPAPAPIIRMAPQGELARVPASADQALMEKPAAKMSKAAPAALPPLEQGLMEILRLREAGDTKAADEKLLALHKRFPKEDLPARLEALRKP